MALLDIRGSLKNTKINKSYYIVVDELFSNAIEAFLIRKQDDRTAQDFQVIFDINFYDKDLEGNEVTFSLKCTDNGVGLGDQQTKAFITKDTTYKDDLAIVGIGKCKGSGRIQYFHYFSKIRLESIFKNNEGLFKRKVIIDSPFTVIDESSFTTEPVLNGAIGTIVRLDGIKTETLNKIKIPLDLKKAFSVSELRKHILITFLQRLVSLKDMLGSFSIKFQSEYKDQFESVELTRSDLPFVTETKKVEITHSDLNVAEKYQFLIYHYKLNISEFNLKKNTVALCAKSAIVLDITKRYLKAKAFENNAVEGLYHVIFVEGEYLDINVNEQRDGYNLPDDKNDPRQGFFFSVALSLQEIYDEIDKIITEMLCPPSWDKDIILTNVMRKYGISKAMISESNIRVHIGDDEDSIVKRVLTSYQGKIIKDTSEIFNIKNEILQLEPDGDDFRERINDLAWKYTTSMKNIDMLNLSQVVVRRTAILEVLSMAVQKNLTCQINQSGRSKDESLIHNIFFPMRKDSTETSDHDIWILSEEYQYYDYIASDKPLSKIQWNEKEMLFDSDIDEELNKIFAKNEKENSGKRPDIAIFSKEGALLIVEFEAPGIFLDDHVGDLMEYTQLLAAKSRGRLENSLAI